jgi:formate/nitrite transporter FocA (FNT family)
MLGGQFTWADYFIYNEIPVVLGNLVGGLTFVGGMIYATHFKTSPKRSIGTPAE